jgi:hypothetical protein
MFWGKFSRRIFLAQGCNWVACGLEGVEGVSAELFEGAWIAEIMGGFILRLWSANGWFFSVWERYF